MFDIIGQLNSIEEERESWKPDPDSELSKDVLALEKAIKIIMLCLRQIESENKMICTNCEKECHSNTYPEIVFTDSENIICEECSIDFEETENGIEKREETI